MFGRHSHQAPWALVRDGRLEVAQYAGEPLARMEAWMATYSDAPLDFAAAPPRAGAGDLVGA